jgi:dihydrofolate reductase
VTKKRKIIVYIATSADGYIARPDGGVEWLDRRRPPGNYGIATFFRSIDTILWGRKTYELVLKMGQSAANYGPETKNYVFSHHPPAALTPDAEFVTEPVAKFARRLRGEEGKHIWIMGGAGLIASFLDEDQIDEFILNVVPVFIGEGIPLIQPRHRFVNLKLQSVRRFSDGLVRLHYEVQRRAKGGGKALGSRRKKV